MTKHANQPFLAFLKVALLGVSFPLLLTSHNWAQANTKQDNSLVYAQTPAKSTPQASLTVVSKAIALLPNFSPPALT